MVDICPQCGNCAWGKKVTGSVIFCPECGAQWEFLKLPLFVVAGASGVGKTSTVQALQGMTQDFVCMDADFFYNITPHETEDDYMAQNEQMALFSRNIMQCGKPVVWARAGNLGMLDQGYGPRFFSGIFVLALTCSEEELQRRMTQGRGIADEGWIQSSVDYNRWFQEHEYARGVRFERLDVSGLSVKEAAQAVEGWMKEKWDPHKRGI